MCVNTDIMMQYFKGAMTLPSKNKKLCDDEIKSIEKAVEDSGIRAVHPDKLEEWAEYLVQNARKQETTVWRKGSPLEEQSHRCLTSTLFCV